MNYDKSKDEKIKEIVVDIDENKQYYVGLYRYDGGPRKIGITTRSKKGKDIRFYKPGRIPVEHAVKIANAIKELAE